MDEHTQLFLYHLSIHLLTQSTCRNALLCAKHCARHWRPTQREGRALNPHHECVCARVHVCESWPTSHPVPKKGDLRVGALPLAAPADTGREQGKDTPTRWNFSMNQGRTPPPSSGDRTGQLLISPRIRVGGQPSASRTSGLWGEPSPLPGWGELRWA